MKIGKQQPIQSPLKNLWLYVLLGSVFVVGLFAGQLDQDAALQSLRSAPMLLKQPGPPAQDLPALMVDMNFANYNTLLGHREEALESGVYIPTNRDFVTATIQINGSVVPVRVRLVGGPAAHLEEGQKWGLEIHTRQDQQLLGMQRFYLLDPAANNFLNEWAFARALEREGVLVARYQFVHLIWNGDAWGIYALQEGFANELILAQDRPLGVTVRFDTDLLWESIAHFQGDPQAAYADPVGNLSAADFQYFEVDTFLDAAIDRDPLLSTQRERAIGLLRALQTGALRASEVFDTGQYGRFLALVDLWGATQGTSLVNLHYYYSPNTDRLEPIGFNANALGNNARLSLATTYGDPDLQAAYAQQALRISEAAYLDALEDALAPEFRRLQKALSAEYPELAPPWEQLRQRQQQMQSSLNPVQPVFAYLGPPTLAMSGTLRIDVGNVLNLPVEILGFDIAGATFLPVERQWMTSPSEALLTAHPGKVALRAFEASRAPVIRYARFDIPLSEIHRRDNELDFMQELDIYVSTRILGLSATHATLARHGYPDVVIRETP